MKNTLCDLLFCSVWNGILEIGTLFLASVNAISCTMGSFAHFILPVIVGYLTNESVSI